MREEEEGLPARLTEGEAVTRKRALGFVTAPWPRAQHQDAGRPHHSHPSNEGRPSLSLRLWALTCCGFSIFLDNDPS